MTFFAPASRWARTWAASVKTPVDSMTMSTFNCLQGRREGSLVEGDNISAVDDKNPFADLHLAWEYPVRRIITKQVGIGFEIGHIINRDNVQVSFVSLEHRPQG